MPAEYHFIGNHRAAAARNAMAYFGPIERANIFRDMSICCAASRGIEAPQNINNGCIVCSKLSRRRFLHVTYGNNSTENRLRVYCFIVNNKLLKWAG